MSMKKEKPLILLSNDDGVNAKGLNELIRALRGLGEIIGDGSGWTAFRCIRLNHF